MNKYIKYQVLVMKKYIIWFGIIAMIPMSIISFLITPEIMFIYALFLAPLLINQEYDMLNNLNKGNEYWIYLLDRRMNIRAKGIFAFISSVFAICMTNIIIKVAMYFDIYLMNLKLISVYGGVNNCCLLLLGVSLCLNALQILLYERWNYVKAFVLEICILLVVCFVFLGLYNEGVIYKFLAFNEFKRTLLVVIFSVLMLLFSVQVSAKEI